MQAQSVLKQSPRVKTAYANTNVALLKSLSTFGFGDYPARILLVAYKEERQLEVWAANTNEAYKLVRTYPFCSSSGVLGPKRKEGDGQIPEGFYTISYFNPTSSFHLSLKVSYPNASDKVLSDKQRPGGDIFIHGSCVTIGCIPITDALIEELFVLAVEANEAGNTIPVYIFPYRMNEVNMASFEKKYSGNSALLEFWKNLKPGYDLFQSTMKPVKYTIGNDGKYKF